MTTFTKEQLIKFANAILQTETAMASWDCMAGQQAKAGAAIAEIALASLEAEPVAFSDKRNFRDVDGDSTHTARMWGKYNFEVGDMALYAAPPAPVLPEELLSAMEEVLRISDRDHEAWHQARAGIVACRAAMQGKAVSQDKLAFDNQVLSDLYHAQEKRLFKIAQRIKGPAFDKYAYSPSQAIDVLEAAIFGERKDAHTAAMLQANAKNDESPICD